MGMVFQSDGAPNPRRALEDPTSDLVREIVAQSRARSASYGLETTDTPDFSHLPSHRLNELIGKNQVLYNHALPVMETLFAQIANTHNMVILTDDRGMILHTLGDDDFLEKADRVALHPGVEWSEQSKGTNAIGTALSCGQPTLIHADQHYLKVNHFLTCSCAPVLDPYGKVIGALDLTGDHRGFHSHTMALVRMSAQMIENHLFADTFGDTVRIHFHTRQEFVGTLMEGIAAFTHSGRFLSANRSGLFQLGLSLSSMQSHTFSSLFDMPMSTLYEHARTNKTGFITLQMHNGVTVKARVMVQSSLSVFGTSPSSPEWRSPTATAPVPASAVPLRPQAPAPKWHLAALKTGDPQVAQTVDKVLKVLDHDVSILILGETGTGKEWLAQAIHKDSARSQGNFVAVNCASIPEHLIESELFGYEEGAFTGARKRGSMGKIMQANNGTLFLDEIGDMPLELQGRLLRVLQERAVTPLGSGKSVPLNLSVVCATNRPLRDMISKGQFREDLYYRINGLVVRLPALRERSDLQALVVRMLGQWCDGSKQPRLSDAVRQTFAQHPWPGNLRQLHNLLRTACIMATDRGVIELDDLPEDFWLDAQIAPPSPWPANTYVASATTPMAPPVAQAAVAAPATGPAEPVFQSASARLEAIEAQAIAAALKQYGGNVSAAARALGISRNKVYRKIASLSDGQNPNLANQI